MKEHQHQAVVGVGRKKYPQKPCRVFATHKKLKRTRRFCNTFKVPLLKEDFSTKYHTGMKC
jgi:hypothetical protein